MSGRHHKSELERFEDLLAEKKLKLTQERRIVLEEALKQSRHFDADSFCAAIRKHESRISRDTVYRTLPLLLECGVIQKSVGDGRREYFERTGVKGHHDHMVCIGCGMIIEFKSDQIEKLQEQLCEAHGFHLVFHDHRLFGQCRNCQSHSSPK